ncbi:hypothetical protein CVIRNUC_001441 [Coccomyxa viridis]|uniref:Peptidase A2 domain-containing protein n=1 Tax=Coccomyxa viridis TaxID=1274662 RepID=A0AAV1HW41_9CHLO|nr:hypothetical protein CVIRNUC_001441 [Coccomyxa viridis]
MFKARTVLLHTCVKSRAARQRLHVSASRAGEETAAILSRIQRAICISQPIPQQSAELRIKGHGMYLGMQCQWAIWYQPLNGAFIESIKSNQLSFKYGHPGCSRGRRPLQPSWAIEQDGLPKEYKLDDHEALLLTSWVRTSFFCNELAQQHLDIEHVTYSSDQGLEHEGLKDEKECQGPGPKVVVLRLRLNTGKLDAFLLVCAETWRPQQLSLRMCGQPELRTYQDWTKGRAVGVGDQGQALATNHDSTVMFPLRSSNDSGVYGRNTFTAEEFIWDYSQRSAEAFATPAWPMQPQDTHFSDAQDPGCCPAWWTASGHVLVSPSINNQGELGYFILDTGASGCVIGKEAADRLGLQRFGGMAVSGMAGRLESCFRRADSLQLGPVTISNCLFMEMDVGNLIRGAPGKVIGIVGYDIFRRSILTLPAPSTASRSGSEQVQLTMHNPASRHLYDASLQWQTVHMVSNLPHITVRLPGTDVGTGKREALLMVDLGASGIDIIFHSKAVKELGLQDLPKAGAIQLKGVGGAHAVAVTMRSSKMAYVEMGGATLHDVRCMLTEAAGGPDFSVHAHGTLCAGLLARCTTIFDFAHHRMACIQE